MLGRRNEADIVVPSAMDRPIRNGLLTPARGGVILVVCSALGFAYYIFEHFGKVRTLNVDPSTVAVSTVLHHSFREYIPVTGNIVPRTTVFIDAVEGGQIRKVFVEVGEIVKEGDALLELGNPNLQLQVIVAEAQVTEQLNALSANSLALEQNRLRHRRELVQINYQLARIQRELERNQILLDSGDTAAAAIIDLEAERSYYRQLKAAEEEAQTLDERYLATQLERLRESLQSMQLNLSIARGNFENLAIEAPVTGQLTMLDATVGASKRPGERIGQIDATGAFKVSAFIDEFYLNRVAVGQLGTAKINDMEYSIRLNKIFPDVRNRQFEVEFEFARTQPTGIRSGQSVRLQLELGAPAETLTVDNGPFFEDTGGAWVFVLDSSRSVANRRDVTFGRRSPDRLEVLHGLDDGERVITSSYRRFLSFERLQLAGGWDE